jgi:hypothetical protein
LSERIKGQSIIGGGKSREQSMEVTSTLGRSSISTAYSDYLQGFKWDYMATITFKRPIRDSIYHGKRISSALADSRLVRRSFLISEPHTTGYIHYHGLVRGDTEGSGPGLLDRALIGKLLQHECTTRFGYSLVTVIKNMNEVSGYCCKYVSKAAGDDHIDYDFYGDWTTKD